MKTVNPYTAGPDWSFETEGWSSGRMVMGVDEAGRGPLAGPVVAAAVVFDQSCDLTGLRDSKLLSLKQREELYTRIILHARAWGVACCGPTLIDQIGILNATFRSMERAILNTGLTPDLLLVDGRPARIRYPHTALVKGDNRSYSIAAASVIAKVTRDRMMEFYHRIYPEFGFREHKGYPTPHHKEILQSRDPSPIHRMYFAGVQRELFS